MELLFITGNAHKLAEVRALLPEVQAWDLDLPEIQSPQARQVIEAKLLEASRLKPTGSLMVEDTSLYLEALNGLPGPLIKWFIAPGSLGLQGLAELAAQRQNSAAWASTWIGLFVRSAEHSHLQFFEGKVKGQIVPPRGSQGFGWDAIFQPEGSELTFAEMNPEQKQAFSMRSLALAQLKQFLQLHSSDS